MFRKLATILSLFAFCINNANAQVEGANYSGFAQMSPGSAQASKVMSNPVNIFSGTPQLSVPIFNFSNSSGLSWNVSLNYVGGGGVRVAEEPTNVGLGWALNAASSITRTVRGAPDDFYPVGYLFTGAIPDDIRSDMNKYYFDSLDAEQDVFQFAIPGHSGSFMIGKNKQIVVIPDAKIRIQPRFNSSDSTLISFRIITEDGIKYDYNESDAFGSYRNSLVSGDSDRSANNGRSYKTTWYLSHIISPFYTDTIKFNYSDEQFYYVYNLPQLIYVDGLGNKKKPAVQQGNSSVWSKKLLSIEFPNDTRLDFKYGFVKKYTSGRFALHKITLSDSVIRSGYLLEYRDSVTRMQYYNGGNDSLTGHLLTKLYLKSVTPFTPKQYQGSYTFEYNEHMFHPQGDPFDSIGNKIDHWGFLNMKPNGDSIIPQISPYTWGADRSPDLFAPISSTLFRYQTPSGAIVRFYYEANDHYPYSISQNKFNVDAQTNSLNNVTLAQVFNDRHLITLQVDNAMSRSGFPPISGSGNILVSIKSSDGSITYQTKVISLFSLFYNGAKEWAFNIPNGNYRLETILESGTSVSSSFPINIIWSNAIDDTATLAKQTGGVRIKMVEYYDGWGTEPVKRQYYRYALANGKSSGFLGGIPKYDYPYREIVYNGGTTTTDYTAIGSEPIGNLDYTQVGSAGYGYVEIMTINRYGKSNGSTVYEFTGFKEINTNQYSTLFPYAPQDMRAWGIGLPKSVSVFDSTGFLVKKTTSIIGYDTTSYNTGNFRSLKLGHNLTTYFGNPATNGVPRIRGYIGQEYYPSGGRAYVISTTDSIFHSNNSINVSTRQMEYDSNYNLKKVVSSYDKSRGLYSETRLYYPYDYSIGGAVGKLKDSLIISPVVASENWITGDANPRITNASITSFAQVGSFISPDTIFAFESNKPIPESTIGVFNPTVLNRSASYFKPKNVFTQYDNHGRIKEGKNVKTGIYNSIIRDYGDRYEIANVSNGRFSDIAYTSFEADGSGNWTIGSNARDAVNYFTGKRGYNLSSGNITKSGLSSSEHYLITFWAQSSGATINGAYPAAISYLSSWNLYSKEITGVTSITISGSGVIDELRLHPKDADMTTVAYEPTVGPISNIDPSNSVIHTEYDNLNRVILTRDKNRNILQRIQYEDTPSLINTDAVWDSLDGTQCDLYMTGLVYKNLIDINRFSDSVGYIKSVLIDTNYCTCKLVVPPDYKIVSGVCEKGIKVVTSSTYVRVGGVWKWRCIYHFVWSDSSVSENYTEYLDETCWESPEES